MEFREDFLVDPRLLIGLATVDNGELVAQFALDYRLDHRIEVILHIRIVRVVRVQQADNEGFRSLERL